MRILVVIYEYPPIGGGGGRAAQDICRQLAARGHKVQILTAHLKGIPHLENQDGVLIKRITSARRLAYQAGLVPMSGFVIAGSLAGLRQAREWRPNVIHVHFAVPSGPVAWIISRFSGAPYVLTAHLGDVPNGVPEKTAHWFRWIYPFTPPIWRNAACVTAVSEHTRQLALRHYPVDIQVIPNGVDLADLDPGEIKVNHPPRIVFAGRFMSQKNPLQLVHSLAQLGHLDWQCVMLGDGPLHAKVENEIRSAGLQDRFTLPGWVTPEEVIDWLSKSDLLFMPSLSEGLPIIGVQSLAMGLGLVVSRIGGFIDLVDEGHNGYLVDPSKPDDYAKTLAQLLQDPAHLLEIRLASRQKAQSFDIHHIADAYEKLFYSIVQKDA